MRTLALLILLAQADEKEADEAIQKFKLEMKSPEAARRAEAVAGLGRVQHEKVLKLLGSCLGTDETAVRAAAAKAIGLFLEKKVRASALLLEALGANAKEPDVQAAILGALNQLREESSLGAAYRYIDDRSAKVAEAAIALTGTVRSRTSIDPLIRLMKKLQSAGEGVTSGNGGFDVPPDEQLRERARRLQGAAVKALQSITGEKWSAVGDWEIWWKKNAAVFKVKN